MNIVAAFVAAGCLALAGCAKDSSGALTGSLTPGAQKAASIACAVDVIAQPIALPFISGLPTIGGIAASADVAIGHPLVVKACNDLAASLGTGAGKPVIAP